MQWLVEGLIILAMLAVNAVFAAYEMALASVSRARLAALAQANRHGAHAAVHMKERLEKSLAVVQVGITLAGAIAAATGGAGVDEFLSPVLSARFGLSASTSEYVAVALFVLPLSALTIVFAELVPKMVAIKNNERVALLLSPAMQVISCVAYPAIFLLEASVKQIMKVGERVKGEADPHAEKRGGLLELRAAASLARASRVIGALEEKIVVSAVQLSERSVREVMLPAEEIAMIPENASMSDALIQAHVHMHTRYPTCAEKGNPQTITGYVNFKDIVATLRINPADPRLKNVIRPIRRMDARTTLAHALEQMVRDSVHIALVTEADRTVVGVITMENIVEELVGSIDDEYDRLPVHIHPLAVGWIAGGGAPMLRVSATTGLAPPEDMPASASLATWCEAHHSGPLENDMRISADGLEVRIRKIRRRKVMEAVIRRSAVKNATGRSDGR
jgi:putative hemolysin